MKHAMNSQIAAVDKAKSCECINQLRVSGYRAVVENILRRNSTDKPAGTIDFNSIRKMFIRWSLELDSKRGWNPEAVFAHSVRFCQ